MQSASIINQYAAEEERRESASSRWIGAPLTVRKVAVGVFLGLLGVQAVDFLLRVIAAAFGLSMGALFG